MVEAAEAYEALLVPALFGQWPGRSRDRDLSGHGAVSPYPGHG